MPDCRKCGIHFSAYLRENGREYNLGSRKFCLTCSPRGAHNTSSSLPREIGIDCTCIRCSRRYKHDKSKGHSKKVCGSCLFRARSRRMKARAVEYKGGKCVRCGYSKCNRALQFHHTDRETKSFNISRLCTYAWAVVEKELDKTILLCGNCHCEEEDSLLAVVVQGRTSVS